MNRKRRAWGQAILTPFAFSSIVLFSSFSLSSPAAATNRLADERLIFRTPAGDLVFHLFPDTAPKHVRQILKLARSGLYDGTHFYRLEPGFVLQLSDGLDRTPPPSEAQKALIQKIPGEFSAIPHERGVLSMARYDGDPNSATTSFSILLGKAPHLDGKYTVFGELESGEEVLRELEKAQRDPNSNRPRERLPIFRIEVATAAQLKAAFLRKAVPLPTLPSQPPLAAPSTGTPPEGITRPVSVGATIALIAAGLFFFFAAGRFSSRVIASSGLLCVLIGLVALFIVLEPIRKASPAVASALLVGFFLVFRLMGQFESPSKR